MNTTTLSLFESSVTTMTNATKVAKAASLADQVGSVAATVFRVCAAGNEPRAELGIDDLIADLCKEDLRLEAAVEEGRRWVGRTLYADEPATLRKLRLAAGMSQKQLAAAIGSSQSYIANIEAGKVEPGVFQVERLATALGQPNVTVFEAIVGEHGVKHHG